MRITVKYLQEQLENERVNSKRYYNLWQEAKNELEKDKHSEMIYLNNKRDYESNEIRRLMDVIMVLAKDPRLTIPKEQNY